MSASALFPAPAPAQSRAPSLAARLRRELAAFDVRPAQVCDVVAARQFAAALIGETIVTARDLERVHRLTDESALFVAREDGELTGVLAFVLLNVSGLRAVLTGAFDALSPAAEHVAGPGAPACAFYGWGVAATTKPSARRLIGGARQIMGGACGHLPKFARPTTEAGHRLMRERLGFEDLPGSFDGLVWQPPMEQAVAA